MHTSPLFWLQIFGSISFQHQSISQRSLWPAETLGGNLKIFSLLIELIVADIFSAIVRLQDMLCICVSSSSIYLNVFNITVVNLLWWFCWFCRKWPAFWRSSGPIWLASPVSCHLRPETGRGSRTSCRLQWPRSRITTADWTASWALSWSADLQWCTAGRWNYR